MRQFVKRAFRHFGYDTLRAGQLSGQLNEAVEVIGEYLSDGSVIFDIGANVGQSSHAFRSMYPAAFIHAFEPDPATFDQLTSALSGEQNIILNQLAFGSLAGSETFFRYKRSVMSSFLPAGSEQWDSVAEQFQVAVSTVDAYCAEKKIDRIDILKIDTQGNDLEVLRGTERMLAKIGLIKVELIFAPLYDGQHDPLSTIAWLKERGFRLLRICDQVDHRGVLGWADGLFVNPSTTDK